MLAYGLLLATAVISVMFTSSVALLNPQTWAAVSAVAAADILFDIHILCSGEIFEPPVH
jgi:hypothetical protein